MPSEPDTKCQAGVYNLHWRDEYLDVRVDRVHVEKAGVYGEILIRTTAPGYNPHIHGPVHFNLISTSARVALVKHLNAVLALDWSGVLEQTCYYVVETHREGTPAVHLADYAPVEALAMRVCPLLQEKQPTVFFGEGDSLKSFFATYLSVLVQTGTPALGLTPIQGNVLFLDYETDVDTFWERANMITTGLGIAIPDGLYYRSMVGSLTDEFPGVNKLVMEKEIEFVVVDSAGPATIEPEKAETVIPFFRCLRALNATSLVIAHVTKTAKGDYPFGCYSADTEVLTSDGWKPHADVTLSDLAACFNMETNGLEWHHPMATHGYTYSGPMVRINGGSKASLDMLVTPNHHMVVRPAYRLPTGTGRILKNPRTWHYKEASQLKQGTPWKVPYAPEPDRSQTGGGETTFARFLGWWISEGCLNDFGPVLTQVEGPLAVRMRETVTALGYESNVWLGKSRETEQTCMQMRLRGATELGRWLAANCGNGAFNKHLPTEAFSWSIEARQALFDALLEGDGCQSGPHRWTYTTISEHLADDVQHLAITLGYSGRVRKRSRAKLLHHDGYIVQIGQRRTLTIRGERNISSIPYDGKVYCLTVPTGAYITRRRGAMAIAGNSAYWRNLPRGNFLIKADRNGDDVAISLRHTKSNNGRRLDPLGFRFEFQENQVQVKRAEPSEYPDLVKELPLRTRLIAALRHGMVAENLLVQTVDDKAATVNRVLNRYKGRIFTKYGNQWGLLQQDADDSDNRTLS